MVTIVITGANRGIGLALAEQYQARGDHVIAAVRTASPELTGPGIETFEGVDVTDDGAVARFASALEGRGIDVLINNAGILTREPLDDLDWERMRTQFEVNALGPLRVTRALLPCFSEGSKVAIISSRVGSLGDNSSGNNYGYRMSKVAVNMAGVNLSHDLKDKDIPVILLHPGHVRTGLTGMTGGIDPGESARGLIDRIDETNMERTGTFWHANGTELPW
ncbi:MAG TPA: SDR family oxidoreductase [Rhizobiales bacterium]|nr:C-factor [bacterium BMS3Bbin10]HDO52677.1 SDR family oxidoreductase [Hyphomicrobiales bacterium]